MYTETSNESRHKSYQNDSLQACDSSRRKNRKNEPRVTFVVECAGCLAAVSFSHPNEPDTTALASSAATPPLLSATHTPIIAG